MARQFLHDCLETTVFDAQEGPLWFDTEEDAYGAGKDLIDGLIPATVRPLLNPDTPAQVNIAPFHTPLPKAIADAPFAGLLDKIKHGPSVKWAILSADRRAILCQDMQWTLLSSLRRP